MKPSPWEKILGERSTKKLNIFLIIFWAKPKI